MPDTTNRKLADICLMGICNHGECYNRREAQSGSARGIQMSDFDAFGNLKTRKPRSYEESK